ncbi:DUF3747 domain-containing protein [Leptothoe sp. PORK10 BA2]|uniref:DUF3747 domain-containing protein n=1 Tax=Leptothoe sp. PORK10 BA2 TaxID=3110254 RepID=UPI002B214783|nr:DUF3747 domain-containing protein [Leptothoe sp. PORK10 BA2]MEA5465006.1 DUF3747 domain-containing protein [Leptothoe sp. PORK10 BA2]
MKSFLRKITTLSAVAAAFGATITMPSVAAAAQFGQQPIADERVVALAEPVSGGRFYKLLIIEQLSSARPCWEERPGTPPLINPLLLTFDFTGICGRSSDSNGYSIRIGGEDLGSRYQVQVEKQGDILVLVASPSPLQRGLPRIELGRSTGVANDFVKLELDAGWTMTRRVYNGQTLGHIYLTNNQSLDTVIAAAGSRPVTPSPSPTPQPTPTTPLPSPPSGTPLPRPGNPAPGNNANVDYQVIVPGGSDVLRSQVNAVEPGAFRTTVNGQQVIQAGRFREQSRANELRQRLVQAGLSAQIVELAQVSTPPRPTPTTPSGDVIYQVIVPGGSDVLRSRVNAVESGAFRTTVDGQTVIQAGRFQEQSRADQLQRRLLDAGLDARIVQTTATTPPTTPSPSPPTPAARQGEVLIMIDPGHGGRDPGAVGNGLQEKEINLFISRRVQSTLEQRGYRVALTRNSDVEVDLQPRVDVAERANATVFVSIHANAISLSRPEVNGLETYYYSSGRSLAQAIHSSVLRSTNLRDRGVRQARFYVLRNTSMPAVLVETGFITGSEDSARFQSNAAREQIADAIAQGIIDYLR